MAKLRGVRSARNKTEQRAKTGEWAGAVPCKIKMDQTAESHLSSSWASSSLFLPTATGDIFLWF